MHVQKLIKHSLAHLQDLILTLAGIKYINYNTSQVGTNSCRFVQMLYWYMCLATYVCAKSYRLVHYSYMAIFNWFKMITSFLSFYYNPYCLFQIQAFNIAILFL